MTSELRLDISQQRPFALKATLNCKSGELLALLGPSGCGKSTLLRMIAGLQHAESGYIRLNNEIWCNEVVKLTPQQRHIGYVPQHYGLFPHMTALQNVKAALHGLPSLEQSTRAQTWLDKVKLSDFAHRKPATLSGGQQQRVALARALAAHPSILLLDEPFSALDSMTREGLYRTLAELKPQLNIPMILVTHNLHEAQLLADHIAVMGQGCILQQGTPDAIMQRPVNRAVAAQVGLRNIFSSTVISATENHSLLSLGSQTLAVAHRLSVGSTIEWCMPHHALLLTHQHEEATHLTGNIDQCLRLGDQWLVSINLPGTTQRFELQCASSMPLATHQPVSMLLNTEHIHILQA